MQSRPRCTLTDFLGDMQWRLLLGGWKKAISNFDSTARAQRYVTTFNRPPAITTMDLPSSLKKNENRELCGWFPYWSKTIQSKRVPTRYKSDDMSMTSQPAVPRLCTRWFDIGNRSSTRVQLLKDVRVDCFRYFRLQQQAVHPVLLESD